MSITKDTINHIAYLARIELKPQELENLSAQLQDILDFIDKLNKLDTQKVSPTSHILPIKDVFRKDSSGESLPVDKTLKNAPSKEGNFFSVPKVIE
jgi:aspartyl-tRNA(Asn)/glutamyl-tRNA(Gln) amidotransferase subunit C